MTKRIFEQVAAGISSAAAVVAWALLAIWNMNIVRDMQTFGEPFRDHASFVIVPVAGVLITAIGSGWLLRRGKWLLALLLGLTSLVVALFFAFIEGASRTG